MTDVLGDEEFTELVDANVPRVDLVGAPANGSPGFLLMKQDAQAGLMPAQTIRDLLGKSAEASPQEETVTMTGSPGAIAKLIHEASLRRDAEQVTKEATYDELVKAKYDADDLKRMAANGEAMKDESYPIADKEDLTRAVRAVGRGGSSHDAIRRHIMTRAKSLGATSEIPGNWNKDGSLSDGAVSKMVGGDLDDGVDQMDPTVVLAAPCDDMPGDPADPGSPAWEAIDAATAQKWLSISYRVKNALGVMAERELLEAASADPDDAEDAWNLQDAQCAMDYVISILANFASDEQAEADLACEAMDMVGKALGGFDTAPLDTIEALASVRKAGRTLSSANEQAIRDAVGSLQKVLASLPAPVEKTANEEPEMPQPTTVDETVRASGQEPAMGTQEAEPKAVAGQPVTDMSKSTATVGLDAAEFAGKLDELRAQLAEGGFVAKADGDGKKEVVVVYDQSGRLVGIVDPDDITPVANAEASPDDMSDTTADAADDGSDSGDDTDLQAQPAGDAGTAADAVPSEDDDEAVTKSTPDYTELSDMFKSSLRDAVEEVMTKQSAAQDERLATIGDAVLEVAGLVETLKGRIGALEEQPAEPKVFTQGVGPRPLPQHVRGQNAGGALSDVDFAKAAELKEQLYHGTDAKQRDEAFREMQGMAIAQLEQMRRR